MSSTPGPDELAERLRESGYRLTPQRRAILEAIEELGHATPEELASNVAGVNLSTVYRTLEVLEGLGLVRHAHLSDRAPTYHSTREPVHLHVVCRGCQRVISVDPGLAHELIGGLAEHHDFEADLGHLTVHGRCGDCRESFARKDP